MSKGIVVVGSLNLDRTLEVAALPKGGETISAFRSRIGMGGKGANQAVAAARAGAKVVMIGMVGDDEQGRWLTSSLRGEGIDASGVMVRDGAPTGEALIMVENSGENAIVLNGGANQDLTPAHILTHLATVATAGLLLVQCEVPAETVELAIRSAAEVGVPVILDPAPAAPVRRDWLRHIAFITPNEHELSQLSGLPVASLDETADAAKRLLALGARTVLAKRGADGVLIVSEKSVRHVPALRLNARDTTGAGDMFAGAFAASWLERADLEAAVEFASVAAGLSTLSAGASSSFPGRPKVLAELTARGSHNWRTS